MAIVTGLFLCILFEFSTKNWRFQKNILLLQQMKYEMPTNISIDLFSKHLFWDIDRDSFNLDQCPAQIIERVLERGEWQDWCLIRDYYSLPYIADVCKKLRSLSPEALSFICCVTQTQKEDYRCYHFAQSNPTLWNC